MRQWHVEHMEKTLMKFITGLSEDASSWQKRQHKKYATLTNTCRNINYDIKHGVTNEEVLIFLNKVRKHPSFSNILTKHGSLERLDEVEKYFASDNEVEIRRE